MLYFGSQRMQKSNPQQSASSTSMLCFLPQTVTANHRIPDRVAVLCAVLEHQSASRIVKNEWGKISTIRFF